MPKQIKPGTYADVMPDMSDEEFEALKQSIDEDGLRHPIEITEGGTIVDGHHRYRACRELGIDPETTVVDDPTVEQAIRANFTRRNLSDGSKRDVVVQYLEGHYEGDRTQEEIASELGVSQPTVSKAMERYSPNKFTREEKRQQAKAYLREHPEASNRKVAREIEADVSHPTVGNWRDEWAESHGDDAPAGKEPDDETNDESDVSGPDSAVAGDGASVSGPSKDVSGPTDEGDDTDGKEASADGGAATSSLAEKGEFETDVVGHTAEASDGSSEEQPTGTADTTDGSNGGRIRELEARVNELEDVLSDMVDAFENHDAEKLERIVNERASGVLDA